MCWCWCANSDVDVADAGSDADDNVYANAADCVGHAGVADNSDTKC